MSVFLFLRNYPLASFAAFAAAHFGGHKRMSDADFEHKHRAARKRQEEARKCSGVVETFNADRRVKRSIAKRAAASAAATTASSTLSLNASPPTYSTIQNFTCLATPEVIEGPYYINDEFIRQDLRENQTGVTLLLDIGILDVEMCQPIPNAFVEIWNTNATGVYSSYPAATTDADFAPVSLFTTVTVSDSATALQVFPSGGPLPSIILRRNETFLRGGFPTDENGMIELKTIYPGFYDGRTPHIHTMVHLDWEANANGTLASHSGTLAHVGQFFMDDSWNDRVFAIEPYASDVNNRTYNVFDALWYQENADGYNAELDLEMLGDSLDDGLLAYITIGVNASASYNIVNTNYYNSSGPS